MKPITKETRKFIIAANERGEKPSVIAIWFDIAESSVYNIIALHKKTGDITPKPYPGRPGRLTDNDLDNIRSAIKEKNDITLDELIDKLNLPIKKTRLSEIVNDMDLPFKGTLNAEFFEGWVEQVLAPTLSFGDIVFLDNYSVHKVAGVLEPIYARGATPVFLPEYSPDLNPIELMWSKVKSVLRKLKPRTFDELMESLKQALDSVTYDDIVGWFKHHGYILNN
ncbi:MAG: transposase [Oscillospiraceae bacterium]|nr:transposase [Oscillospiraceae bacterium]